MFANDETDDYIIKAERLLLPDGCTFDDERRNFIKNLSTLDLIAVPGSGKTTALQAKLCCLENFMPLKQGVLVLAHTNVAVNEIKKNLLQSCHKLFEYPNFVGTIQDFVDTYLAIPYYQNKYRHSVLRIDDDVCNELINRFLERYLGDKVFAYYYRRQKNIIIYLTINEDGNIVLGNQIRLSKIPSTWNGMVKENINHIENLLLSVKRLVFRLGYLSYNDCYVLAQKYLMEMPILRQILRKQFKYIFVDEAQDLEKKQIQLIDDIFLCDDCVLQRIGDINQSIHLKSDCAWKPRNMVFIKKSLRLTQTNGMLVNAFTKDRFAELLNINGIKSIGQDIKPHIILFDYTSKDKLKPFFGNLIVEHNLQNTDEGEKYGFHIVGWVVEEKKEKGKYALEDYFPECKIKVNNADSQLVNTLNKYIQLDRKHNTSRYCINSIYRILCEFARLVEYRFNDKMLNTRNIKKWFSTLQEDDKEYFDIFIFESIKLLILQNYEKAYTYIKGELCGKIISIFGKRLNPNANLFLEKGYCLLTQMQTYSESTANDDNLKIEIESVHSAKGMTHCATLYVETFYEGKYESTYCIMEKAKNRYYPNPLLFQNIDSKGLKVHSTQAIKMMYVGFSRPTHLLCFAMLKSNFDANNGVYTKEAFENAGWIVDDLTMD